MKEIPVRTDTILLMIFAASVVLAVWVLNIARDVQDLQTRATITEENMRWLEEKADAKAVARVGVNN